MVARFRAGTFERIAAVLEDDEDRTSFVRKAVERELAARRPRARAPPERVRVERREEPPLVDTGLFAAALTREIAGGRECPPVVPNLRPGTRFSVRLAPPVERGR
jgi:hypothetical protein